MKHMCKTLVLLLLTVLVGLSGLTAYAHDVPDESKKGSITVDFEYDNKAVTCTRSPKPSRPMATIASRTCRSLPALAAIWQT